MIESYNIESQSIFIYVALMGTGDLMSFIVELINKLNNQKGTFTGEQPVNVPFIMNTYKLNYFFTDFTVLLSQTSRSAI
ncbi:hypothetical protein J2T14_006016 [Paenibacillus harenae]|nr:hypothetical protein [Paenibacillus harenae]